MTHNHTDYQSRIDFVQNLLRKRLILGEDAQITPIQYDPECPFKYNNFVYRVELALPVSLDPVSGSHGVPQSGCVPIPAGTKELILRLANPNAEGMHAATRVENEVAIISLATAALNAFETRVVPSVYGWGSAAATDPHTYGWILEEFMPGAPVDEAFKTMSLDEKRGIFVQMTALLEALQEYKLPDSITSFGGATFDDNGHIVSAAMTSVGAGPWLSYEDSFKARLKVALRKADENPYIQGWRANGVRERLDAFVERGVPAQFESLDSKHSKVVVHADFTTNNLLFDSKSGRITALIDFDFACISHPSYEFLRSFDGAGGQFRGWSGDEAGDKAALRDAKLHGFPSPLPKTTEAAGGVNWPVAKAWEDELERQDVKRPRTIPGIDRVANVDTVLRSILPWRLSNSDILRLQSEKIILKCRQENEGQLVQLLGHLGF